ncbi:ATP-dependent DNA ligase [Microbacterium sp. LjRoot45]|uniref:DUF7882 family protein n=1 Tax=Microbacterium sp. LjRoot45 TaxID=3342329 RepID=UPI003ECCCE31
MGRLVYDGLVRLSVDDRTLTHLQVVIGDKLRRREAFTLSWANGLDEGGGRVAIWVHPGAALSFTFDRGERHRLNRAWLVALANAANTSAGLQLVPEPTTESDAETAESTS